MVLDGADGDRIHGYAVESGMATLKTVGLRKAVLGLTSLEEVLSVAVEQE
jgi:type II secretory ATPase GspE/PulE/Tfp pilus assembly ATPase PilB-like protein